MRLPTFAALAALPLLTTGAAAADFATIPLSSDVEVPIAADSGFDWSGFYAGVYGVVQNSELNDVQVGAGLVLGANAQFDVVLLGGEVALQGLTGDTVDTAYGQVLGRAGLVLTDEVLLYATAGYGFDLDVDESDFLVGVGAEVALSEDLSLRGQYLRSFPDEGGNTKDQVTFGANFHF